MQDSGCTHLCSLMPKTSERDGMKVNASSVLPTKLEWVPTPVREDIVSTDTPPSPEEAPITVAVGEGADCRTFYIHPETAKYHSDFFVAALRNEWKERADKTIRLPEDDPTVFRVFATFLYSGHVGVPEYLPVDVDGDGPDDEMGCMWIFLAQAWLLGEKLQSISFSDAVIDVMTTRATEGMVFTAHVPALVWPGSARMTCLKKFLVDVAAYSWDSETLRNSHVRNPLEFVEDLAAKMLRSPVDWARVRGGCVYHEHLEMGKPCYKLMFPCCC